MGKCDSSGERHTMRRKGIRGEISRKRVLSRKPSSFSSSERVVLDDDSGLGDSSLDSESTPEVSLSNSSSIYKSKMLIEMSRHPGITSHSLSTIDTNLISANFGIHSMELEGEILPREKDSRLSKRLRLDPTEEANELPGEKSATSGDKDSPPLLSFKNVPAILTSLKPVQKTPLLCIDTLPGAKILPINPITPEEKPTKKRPRTTSALEGNFPSKSSDGTIELKLLTQPEEQHRARYQTEGSRGAVKDRAGQGHPTVKLFGTSKSCILQVFVASDGGAASPHLFYQGCKVTGKNSTPCQLEKINGTALLKIAMLPDKEMTVSCDCVGILKERNVDVEQRMRSCVSRGRKKSTKCRLVFRTVVALPSGAQETIQIVSQTISCTQPPGIPEICRKSLSECKVTGGEELFIIGKNLKDAEVIFQEVNEDQSQNPAWMQTVIPDKEYLQPTHLICEVPPYRLRDIKEEVKVQVLVVSCGKTSEPSMFKYLPLPVAREAPQAKSVQLQHLPKGVSPSAVELNMLYTKSGGGLSLGEGSSLHQESLETRPLIAPVRVPRALATVAPEVRCISAFPMARKNVTCTNTLTTATVITPRPSLSGKNMIEVSSQNGREYTEIINKDHKDCNTKANRNIDNLVSILKLVCNSKSSDIRTMLVESLMDEIVHKIKDEKEPLVQAQSDSGNNELLQSLNQLSSLLGAKNAKINKEGKREAESGSFVHNVQPNLERVSQSIQIHDLEPETLTNDVKMQTIPQFTEPEVLQQNVNLDYTSTNTVSTTTMPKWVVNNPIYPTYLKVNNINSENTANPLKMETFNKTDQTPSCSLVYDINVSQGSNYPSKEHTENLVEAKPIFNNQHELISVKNETLNLRPVLSQSDKNSVAVNIISNDALFMTQDQGPRHQHEQHLVSFISKNVASSEDCISTLRDQAQQSTRDNQSHYSVQVIPENHSKVCHSLAVGPHAIPQSAEAIQSVSLNDNPNVPIQTTTQALLTTNNHLSSLHVKHKSESLAVPQTNGICTMTSKNSDILRTPFSPCNVMTTSHINMNSSSEIHVLMGDPLLCQSSSQASQISNSPILEPICSVPPSSSVPMPPEVTNAISNLSENELLNYFNPSCFDNV